MIADFRDGYVPVMIGGLSEELRVTSGQTLYCTYDLSYFEVTCHKKSAIQTHNVSD